MEPKPFLEKLGSKVVSKLAYFGLTWDQWAKFAKMTRSLDYGCNFGTGKSICSQSKYYKNTKGMCCCGNCLSHVGYIRLVPDDEEIIREIASLFSEVYGFWRAKKGCVLPIKYRSSTCIAYRCCEARDQRNKTMSVGFSAEALEQMTLYFLETLRTSELSNIQMRTIIKELIK